MHGYKVKTIFINFHQKEKKKKNKTRFIKTAFFQLYRQLILNFKSLTLLRNY